MKYTLAALGGMFIVIGFTSFVYMDIDPSSWSDGSRAATYFMGLLVAILSVVGVGTYEAERKKREKEEKRQDDLNKDYDEFKLNQMMKEHRKG